MKIRTSFVSNSSSSSFCMLGVRLGKDFEKQIDDAFVNLGFMTREEINLVKSLDSDDLVLEDRYNDLQATYVAETMERYFGLRIGGDKPISVLVQKVNELISKAGFAGEEIYFVSGEEWT